MKTYVALWIAVLGALLGVLSFGLRASPFVGQPIVGIAIALAFGCLTAGLIVWLSPVEESRAQAAPTRKGKLSDRS